jgi:hypothetical protein
LPLLCKKGIKLKVIKRYLDWLLEQ